MTKLYDLITWHNNTNPALNEDNLNAMSQALDEIDDRVVELATDVLVEVPKIKEQLAQADAYVEQAKESADAAAASAGWAETFDKQAESWAEKSKEYSESAASSASDARQSKGDAIAYASAANRHAINAENSATAAATSASDAATSETNAGDSASAAADSASAAAASATTATEKAESVVASAEAAANSATAAAGSATEAAGSLAAVKESEENAHGWADGQADPEEGWSASNNAKYWALAAQAAAHIDFMDNATIGIGKPDTLTAEATNGMFTALGVAIKSIINEGAEEFSATWLKDMNGNVLTPDGRQLYRVVEDVESGASRLYYWNGSSYDMMAGGGSDITIGDVSGATVTSYGATASLKWSDPADTVLDGTTLAKWAGTLVVRKAGSAPESRRDGTIILNNTTRNAYASTAFEDAGLTYGVTYYYRFFPYTTGRNYTDGSSVSVVPTQIRLNVPTLSSGLIYDGTEQEVTVSAYDSTEIEVTGTKGTNAGDYTATFHLLDQGNYRWSDNSTEDKAATWTIEKKALTVPAVSDTEKTYNGSAQHPTVAGYDETTMSRAGYEYTDAGDYTLAFALLDGDNYEWGSATTSFAWSIAQADGAVTLSANSVELDADHVSVTVTISGATGAITIASDDPSIAAVSPASMAAPGGVLTITSPDEDSGTATITVSVAATANYKATSGTVAVTASFARIYGAEWDGTSTTAWSRTDAAEDFIDPVPAVNGGTGSSPFDDILPWSGMTRVTDATAGELVRIPKFYYKLTQTGAKVKIQVSAKEFDGASVSPTHMDRGDGKGERDEIFIGRYHCVSGYKSSTGAKPLASITRSTARTGIHNLGSTYYQMDFATRFTIWLLYIVEFADWNSQAKIGYGCGNNSATENMGYTDSMKYHTGTTKSARTTYGVGTQYRYIEGLWDNVYDWMDGCYYNSSGMNVILNPANFSDRANGINIGKPTEGWPGAFTVKDVSGTFPTFIPTATGGSESTFSCDSWNFDASGPCLYVGGNYDQVQNRGLFCVDFTGASGSSAGHGCRLLKLP